MSAKSKRQKTAMGVRSRQALLDTPIKTGRGAKKLKTLIPTSEALRQLSKDNQEIAQQLSAHNTSREILFHQIESLEEHLMKDNDVIAGLRSKLSQLSRGTYETGRKTVDHTLLVNTPRQKSDINSENIVEYLQNSPLIINEFMKMDPKLPSFFDVFKSLDPSIQSLFLGYSIAQLSRFSACIASFQHLSQLTNDVIFNKTVSAKVKSIFNADSVETFIYDAKTGDYASFLESIELQIKLEGTNSLLEESINTGKITFAAKGRCGIGFDFDSKINPKFLPTMIVPLEKTGILVIIFSRTRSLDSVNREDQLLAQFVSNLLTPLFGEFANFLNLIKEVETRRALYQFEMEISSKTTFDTLLPYLLTALNEFFDANDAELFIQGAHEFYSFEVSNGKLVQKHYPDDGVPHCVVESKVPFVTSRLLHDDENFNDLTDGWTLNKSLCALPIFAADQTVYAVLAVSQKLSSNKFTARDVEFLQKICTSLSLVLPNCIQTSNVLVEKQSVHDLKLLPNEVTSFTYEQIETDKSLDKLIMRLPSFIGASWMTIYFVNEETITKRITIHGKEIVDKVIASDSFIINSFKQEESVISSEIKNHENFAPIPDLHVKSAYFGHHENIGILAINGKFDKNVDAIVKSFLALMTYAIRVSEHKTAIHNSQVSNTSLKNVLDVCSTAVKNEFPLYSLLNMITDLISMGSFIIFRYKKLNKGFDIPCATEGVKNGIVPEEDALIDFARKQTQLTSIEKFASTDYSGSKIVQYVPFFTNVIIVPFDFSMGELFLMFTGESPASNYIQMLSYFIPFIKIFLQNYLLKFPSTIFEMNKIDFFKTKLLDSDVSSRLFSVTTLTESQKIEACIKMFQNTDLFVFLQTDIPQFTELLIKIRSAYNNDLPYHNWTHAVDTTQFVYSCLIRGRLRRFFAPVQLAAILLAALCHDVDHQGLNTTYHTKTQSYLYYTYGEQSPLERHHASFASKLLEESSISSLINNQHFWSIFVPCIVATDMVRHFEFLEAFKEIMQRFDHSSDVHKLTLAQFLIKCGNFANTTRPFDVATYFAERIVDEYRMQNEKEKEAGVEISKIGEAEESHKISEVEISFYSAIVAPTLRMLSVFAPDLSDFGIQLEDNKRKWNDYGKT